MPPPIAADGLFNSSLFGLGYKYNPPTTDPSIIPPAEESEHFSLD
jgi:hypothetical protein